MNQKIVLASLFCGAMTCGFAFGWEEEKIDLAKAPAAVQAALTKAVGMGKIEKITKETDDGKTFYEAEFEVADVDHSVRVTDAGLVVEEETEIEMKAVPAAVVEGVKKKYADAKIEKAYEVKAEGKSFYELEIQVGKVDRELQVNAAGTVLKDWEEKDEGDKKD